MALRDENGKPVDVVDECLLVTADRFDRLRTDFDAWTGRIASPDHR